MLKRQKQSVKRRFHALLLRRKKLGVVFISLLCLVSFAPKSRTISSRSQIEGTPIAPWLDPAEPRPILSELSNSKTDSHDDLPSRLTLVADAEIQKILPDADGMDTKMSDSVNQEIPKGKSSEVLPPIGVIKGEREKLLSRTSSMASLASRRQKRRSASHLSERNEEDEEEVESDEEGLAPWLTPAGKKKEKIRMSRGSRSRASRSRSTKLSGERDELKELKDVGGKMESVGKKPGDETDTLSEAYPTDRDSSLERRTGSVTRKEGSRSKAKMLKKGRGTVLKVPRIRLSLRRTSSAKIPKELQERLEKIVEKERRAKSSQGHRDQKELHGFTDSESDWDMKRSVIKTRIDPKNIIKEKKGKDRLKLPKINFHLRRRSSSAKLPKELEEKLVNEADKSRRAKSSVDEAPKDKFMVVSETEGEITANETDETEMEKVSKLKKLESQFQEQIMLEKSFKEKSVDLKVEEASVLLENVIKVEISKAGAVKDAEMDGKAEITDAKAKSVVSKSSRTFSAGTSRRKHGADDTAFEDDDGLSAVDSHRGGAVNRFGEEEERLGGSRRIDERQIDSALEEDFVLDSEPPQELGSHRDVELDNSMKATTEGPNDLMVESQATVDPLSRLTQQSLKSVSLTNEFDLEDIRNVADDGKDTRQDLVEKSKEGDVEETRSKMKSLTDEEKLGSSRPQISLKGISNEFPVEYKPLKSV